MTHYIDPTLDLEIQFIYYCLVLILCICIFSYTIYKIRVHLSNTSNSGSDQQQKKIPKRTIILSIVSMIAFMLNIVCQLIYIIVAVPVNDYVFDSLQAQIPNGLSFAFMFFGQSCIHLLFISRLQSVFKSTQYAISYKTILLFYALVMSFLVFTILISLFHILMHQEVISWHDGQIAYSVLFAIVGILDLTICTILLYLFINRLFSISILVDNEWKGKETRNKLSPILNVITRYFILTVYSIIALQFFLFIGGVVHGHAAFDHNTSYSPWSLEIFYYYFPLQSLIAVYSCAVNFHFGGKLYRCCCGSIHDFCVKKWMIKAKDRIINKSNNDYMLLDQEHNI